MWTPPKSPPRSPRKLPPQVRRLLAACMVPKSLGELQRELGLSDRKHFQKAYLNPALASSFVERTNPERPGSPFQKYRLTDMGKKVLAQTSEALT